MTDGSIISVLDNGKIMRKDGRLPNGTMRHHNDGYIAQAMVYLELSLSLSISLSASSPAGVPVPAYTKAVAAAGINGIE